MNLKKIIALVQFFMELILLVDCIDDESQIYNLFTLRSFGESLYHHITDASLEFGYVGI